MRAGAAAKAFLVALWLVCGYRAATQSITHDEALTYANYLVLPFSQLFNYYDANHHFLNTVLMHFSTSVFGFSEWSMRLPALAGAALYFAGVYRLVCHLFGERWLQLPAVALLTLNPLVLDFLVAARGYSLALGLWFWALATLLPYLEAPKSGTPRHLVESGVALALSVTANLVFLVPAAVLTVFAVAWPMFERPKPEPEPVPVGKGRKKQVAVKDLPATYGPNIWRYFVLPIAGVAVVFFLTAPIDLAKRGDFYIGVPTIGESLRNLATDSFEHSGPLHGAPAMNGVRDAAAFVLVPLIVLSALGLGVLRRNVLLLMAAGLALCSAVLLWISHLATDLPYPMDRTGLYFLVLVPLALLGLIAKGPRPAALAASIVGVALLVVFASELNVREFLVWEYDADTKELIGRLAQLNKDKPDGSVKLAASWQLEPTLNFYRETNHWNWLQTVERSPIAAGANFYALIPADRDAARALRLQTLYQGPVSGTVLASPAH
jgi:hypothetical protein